MPNLKVLSLSFTLAALLTATGCDVPPEDDTIANSETPAIAPAPNVHAPTHKLTCEKGLPTLTVDGNVVKAICPYDAHSAIVTVFCEGPPLLAKAEGENLFIACPDRLERAR